LQHGGIPVGSDGCWNEPGNKVSISANHVLCEIYSESSSILQF
jgi:hypothetical protein